MLACSSMGTPQQAGCQARTEEEQVGIAFTLMSFGQDPWAPRQGAGAQIPVQFSHPPSPLKFNRLRNQRNSGCTEISAVSGAVHREPCSRGTVGTEMLSAGLAVKPARLPRASGG